jgi:hypothetical protein
MDWCMDWRTTLLQANQDRRASAAPKRAKDSMPWAAALKRCPDTEKGLPDTEKLVRNTKPNLVGYESGMIGIFALILLSVLAYGQVGSAPPAPAAASTAPAPAANLNNLENATRARGLLDQAIQALGGDAYLNAKNMGEEGRVYSLHHGESRGVGVQYRAFTRFPDQDRFELIGRGNVVVPLPLVGIIVVSHEKKNKNDIVVVHNGTKGYEITYKGTAPQDPVELAAYLRRHQHSLHTVLKKWTHDPNVALFYDGTAIVDGKSTDQVTLVNGQNDSVTVNLDAYSHLPVKNSFTWRDPDDKQKNVEEEVYDNYRLDEGVMTPHSLTRNFNGEMSHQRFINTAKYNLELADDLFNVTADYDPMAPPKKKK